MMSTDEMMRLALEMAAFRTVPPDSAIYVKGKGIRKILFGIDAGVPELLLAKQMRCDAVISHHPQGGTAILNFHKMFERHVELMIKAGVPKKEAEQAVRKKRDALEVENHARNYDHNVSIARLLKMPYMNIHAPLDEIGRQRMTKQVKLATDKNPNATVGDIVASLQNLSEFKNAQTAIKIRLGKPSNEAGKVVVSHAAGTNGGYEVAKTYFKYGVGTLIYIHVSSSDLEHLRADGMKNLIVTGHISSDSVGINPFLAALEKKGISVIRIGLVS
jgi:putative NIF3 family GTP cyclohydrolase 1 type 2